MAEPIENNISPPEDSEENQIKLGTFELPDPARTIISTMLPVAASLLWEPKDLIIRSEEGVSPNPDIAIFVTQEVLYEVQQHLKSGGAHEHAGFLLGNRHRCPESGREFVLIDNRVEAQYTQTTPLSVTFTFDTWARFKDELENKFRGKMAAGWYHSHPNLGVFLSPDDTGLHSQWFNQPFMSALVIDPVRCEGGFFAQREGTLLPSQPVAFYEVLSRDEIENRRTTITWTNYRCRDPRTNKSFFPQPIWIEPSSVLPVEGQTNGKGSDKPTPEIPEPPPRRPWRTLLSVAASLILLGTVIVVVYKPKEIPPPLPPSPPKPPAIAFLTVQKPQMSAVLGPFVSLPSNLAGPQTAAFDWVKLNVQVPSPWDGDLVATDWDRRNLSVKPDPKSKGVFYLGFRKDVLNALDKTSLKIRGISVGEKRDKYLAMNLQYPEAGFAGRNLEKIGIARPEAPAPKVGVQPLSQTPSPRLATTTPGTSPAPISSPPSTTNPPANIPDTQTPAQPRPSTLQPATPANTAPTGATAPTGELTKEVMQPAPAANPASDTKPTPEANKTNPACTLSTICGWRDKVGACVTTARTFEQCLGPEWMRLQSILTTLEENNKKGAKNRSRDRFDAAKKCLADLNHYRASKKASDQQKLKAALHDSLDELYGVLVGR